MAVIKDTEFRVVLRYKVYSPTSVQEARARIEMMIGSSLLTGTFDLLRIEPESTMKKGVSGAPDKIKTKKRREKK